MEGGKTVLYMAKKLRMKYSLARQIVKDYRDGLKTSSDGSDDERILIKLDEQVESKESNKQHEDLWLVKEI